ncbi:hypothetical protein F4803DRAFT_577671 [Xylaria telfairii]|nr:hypothetical protein F4803DRAFT_577671 [Xylaria telfairii]
MGHEEQPQAFPIRKLPAKILRMILSELPTIPSLHAAILSCASFYHVFRRCEETIMEQVLLNQIDVEVLPEAIVTTESASLVALERRPTLPEWWTLSHAFALSVFHLSVEAWTEKFVAATLTGYPFDQPQPLATRQEICRIQRALYRFEVHCNICGPKESDFRGDSWNSSVKIRNLLGDPRLLLELGLQKLHELVGVEKAMDWYLVLGDAYFEPGPKAFFDNHFIRTYDMFISLHPGLLTPLPYDPDFGPVDVWRWAHPRTLRANWEYQGAREKLRKWGYVMWDRARLEGAGIFRRSWVDVNEEWAFLEDQKTVAERGYPFEFAQLQHMGLEAWRRLSTDLESLKSRKRRRIQ